MIVGTAGHIDHGKTALVKALTGIDADRLAEEKARGITIDLGYAYTPLSNGEILGFVDVPGHEKFVHNMLAGATGIDYALLVVAADDGIMPQTIEHLQILDLLRIEQGAVALTKCDRVEPRRVDEVSASLTRLLAPTALRGAPVMPVSSVTGLGMDALRTVLETAAMNPRARAVDGGFRLAIDRCFTVTGAGTIVTGTVFSGQVRVGDRLLLSPAGVAVRVRGIHAQNRPAATGTTGQRCALNLVGIDKDEVQRGDWVLAAPLHRPSTRIDVELHLLAEERQALRHWTPVHAHIGAFHATARVALLREGVVEPGATVLAQLVLDRPTCAVHRDRLILRDISAMRTIAGGLVLESPGPARGRRSPDRLAILSAWKLDEPGMILRELLRASPHGVDLDAFAANANLSVEAVEQLCTVSAARRVAAPGSTAFDERHWRALQAACVDALRSEHERAPDSLGLNTEQLRLRCATRLARPVFAELLSDMQQAGLLARDGSWWHLPGHEIVLTGPDEASWQRLAPLLSLQPFQPPRVRDIARSESIDESGVRRILSLAARIGHVYRVAHDHYFARDAVADMAGIVLDLARSAPDGGVVASAFRDRIGTGRKLAIHILEFFDRTGLTRRVGDVHRIRNDTLSF